MFRSQGVVWAYGVCGLLAGTAGAGAQVIENQLKMPA